MNEVHRKKLILGITALIIASTLLSSLVTAQEENRGYALVKHSYVHYTDGDSVQNVEQTWYRFWDFGLQNMQDITGQPLVNPNITIVTDLTFSGFSGSAWDQSIDNFSPNETAPPVYLWYWERNLEENGSIKIMADEAETSQFAPGFSLSRKVHPSTIALQTTLQLVKVTVSIEEPFPIESNDFWVVISFRDTDQVDVTYVRAFPRPRDMYGQVCDWRKRAIVGRTYTFFLLLKIVRLVEEQVQYKPKVQTVMIEPIDSEKANGTNMTLFHPEDVTSTFSTENYVEWEGYTKRQIMVNLNLISITIPKAGA